MALRVDAAMLTSSFEEDAAVPSIARFGMNKGYASSGQLCGIIIPHMTPNSIKASQGWGGSRMFVASG